MLGRCDESVTMQHTKNKKSWLTPPHRPTMTRRGPALYALPMIEPNQPIGSALRSCSFFYFFFGSCAALLKELAPLNMFLVGTCSREKGCAVVRSRQANTRNASRRT